MICRLKIRKPALRDKDCGVGPTRRAAFIGSPLQVKKLAHDHTMLYALESKEHRADTYKASEV
jgi:hypothetical protein